ncbi:Ig-like domain repeat protein [Bradyrhizobium liaoningense]|uniref:DUF7933 domain-containing protein n=1 Tax=Bradyrhizobium liaoningense TaxID=43992 RepID=UPI001BA6C321|nr:Ig-like domain repeat protein [Bradyrhizobium liaoningense]MBR0901985.1 Ig-like domain repeat protein [Bradyrhizobium liaoningense]
MAATVVLGLFSFAGPALAQAAIPTLSKSFGAASIPLNGSTTLTFTVTNTSSTDSAANVTFTDSLPAGLVVATPNGLSESCTNAGPPTTTAVAGSGTISFVNPVLGISGSGGSCTVTVNVTGTSNGTKTNLVVVSSFGGAGNMASATITVGSSTPPAVSQVFGAANLAIGGTTSLTVTLNNPNPTSLTGLAFTDNLPAGLVVATPNALTNSCGGTASAAAGGGVLSLSGGTLATSGSCVITINVTATTAGTKTSTIASVTSNEAPPSAAASATISVNTAGTTTTLTSSLNPSSYGQAVTFTATVANGGSTPTGTVTFLDGGGAIGTAVLTGGVATFVTATLSVGSHLITASFSGSGGFAASVSAPLTQVVGVPADSTRLRALQLAVTNIEAHASGAAFESAVGGAIADGFSDSGGSLITSTGGGVHINFAAEPQAGLRGSSAEFDSTVGARERVLRESGLWNGASDPGRPSTGASVGNSRIDDTFGVLAYAGNPMPAKAPLLPVRAPREWQFWADIRGTGWNTDVSAGDIVGGQVNALLGVTRRLTPDFLIGAVGGYENFNYSSTTLNGRLKGDGWTVGGYLGWRISPGIRFDAALARSGVNYNGVSGTASATFPGSRWIVSAGLTGAYKIALLEIEPSAKVYALWEHDQQYLDSLGTLQSAYEFSSGRASGGAKLAYPWLFGTTVTVAPYVGAYADYYFNNSSIATPLLPTQFVQGWSARVTGGLNFNTLSGIRGSVGGELGGLGNDFLVWSVRGRASIPFSF